MKKLMLVVFLLFAYVGVAMAQVAVQPTTQTGPSRPEMVTGVPAVGAVPVLSEVDSLKIENAMLKVQAAQGNLDKMRGDFQALLNSLQKPGYVITQGPDGKLTYAVEPAKDEPK